MKQATTKLTCLLMRASLRLNGWTDAPKPPPYQETPKHPWWRKLSEKRIQSADFITAFDRVMEENKKP